MDKMSRILTLQRQARELGRLRSGFSTEYTNAANEIKRKAERSETWIVSSHSEHYIRAAAELYGGTVERWQPQGSGAEQWRVITEQDALDAILPPGGDPLSQSCEKWSKGGAQRRCDGMTEQLSDSPCLCRKEFGDDWFNQSKLLVCQTKSRLNLILPEMPDIGVWRAETNSYYAAIEIAAHVDLIRSALGDERAVPIRLRIEQRQRVVEGKTKKYPVIAIELRGITAGQILSSVMPTAISGSVAALPPSAAQLPSGGGQAPGQIYTSPSIDAALATIPAEDKARLDEGEIAMVHTQIADAVSRDQLREVWDRFSQHFVMPPELRETFKVRGEELLKQAEGEPLRDVDALWQQVLVSAPEEWTTSQIEAHFTEITGVDPNKATTADVQRYLDAVKDNPTNEGAQHG